LARPPADLEAAELRLLDAGTTEIERVIAVLDRPADRVPVEEVDGVHLFEAVGSAAVLAGEYPVPRAEDPPGGRCVALVRRQNETEARLDHAFEQELEESARLHRDAESPTRLHVDAIESVDVRRRRAPCDPDAGRLRVLHAAPVIPAHSFPRRGDVVGQREVV